MKKEYICEQELPKDTIRELTEYVVKECLFEEIPTVVKKLRKFNEDHQTNFQISSDGMSVLRSDGMTVLEFGHPIGQT